MLERWLQSDFETGVTTCNPLKDNFFIRIGHDVEPLHFINKDEDFSFEDARESLQLFFQEGWVIDVGVEETYGHFFDPFEGFFQKFTKGGLVRPVGGGDGVELQGGDLLGLSSNAVEEGEGRFREKEILPGMEKGKLGVEHVKALCRQFIWT